MALIQCPECERKVSSHAVACPNCGHPIACQEIPSTSNSTPGHSPPTMPKARQQIRVSFDGTGDCQSISEAVDLVTEDGACICIERGTYKESITIRKSVTLLAEDGPSSVTIDATKKNAIRVKQAQVSLIGLTLRSESSASVAATGDGTEINLEKCSLQGESAIDIREGARIVAKQTSMRGSDAAIVAVGAKLRCEQCAIVSGDEIKCEEKAELDLHECVIEAKFDVCDSSVVISGGNGKGQFFAYGRSSLKLDNAKWQASEYGAIGIEDESRLYVTGGVLSSDDSAAITLEEWGGAVIRDATITQSGGSYAMQLCGHGKTSIEGTRIECNGTDAGIWIQDTHKLKLSDSTIAGCDKGLNGFDSCSATVRRCDLRQCDEPWDVGDDCMLEESNNKT